jgi:hypothetical protein
VALSKVLAKRHGLPRALAWIIEGANLFQFSTNNMTQIHNMIHAVNRLHVENGRDIIAIDYVLLYFYTLDERKDASEEATIVSRPASLGISGPSNRVSAPAVSSGTAAAARIPEVRNEKMGGRDLRVPRRLPQFLIEGRILQKGMSGKK